MSSFERETFSDHRLMTAENYTKQYEDPTLKISCGLYLIPPQMLKLGKIISGDSFEPSWHNIKLIHEPSHSSSKLSKTSIFTSMTEGKFE